MDKVFCIHCHHYVSRKTAYNHCRKEKDYESSGQEPSVDGAKESDTVFCEHCNKQVSKSTKYRHSLIKEDANFKQFEVPSSSESDDDTSQQSPTPSEPSSCEPSSSETSSSESVWEDEDHVDDDLARPSSDGNSIARNIVKWLVASITFIQCAYFLSNSCIEKFLLLFSQLFHFLGQYSELCTTVAAQFPITIHMMKKLLKIGDDEFVKYVVCQNCYTLHSYDDVLKGQTVCKSKIFACKAVNSSRKRGKAKCNTKLARNVILRDGQQILYPYKVYCFKGVIENIQRFIDSDLFVDKCNLWRDRKLRNFYADIYDGNVWKSFVRRDGSDFLTQRYHFGLALNVDWFCPYKRRSDVSIGAIYMVVLNLPREERFKSENAMLIALIPAMKKEPETLISFLEPLVKELKALWTGVNMTIRDSNTSVTVKAALMCAAADIPAARKLCGFMGHSAHQGCSHCVKPFNNHDCGVPDLNKWPLRNRTDHIKYAKMAEAAETITGKSMIESRYGYKYTALLELPYFHPSSMYAIDPMHNLFLGTAKRIFTFWVDNEHLSKKDLQTMSQRIAFLQVSANLGGRIPTNIASNYGQMTAKEWKNWTLIYSLYVLKGCLPAPHLNIWQTFVLACKYLCKPCLSPDQLEIANRCYFKFVKEVIREYGTDFVTPNMHLHCHLKESVLSFGSVYGFWLFSFERYNGILNDFPTNKRSIECQLMRRFETSSVVANTNVVNIAHHASFEKLMDTLTTKKVYTTNPSLISAPVMPLQDVMTSLWTDLSLCHMNCSYKIVSLDQLALLHLTKTYCEMYKLHVDVNMLGSVAKKYKCIQWNNELYGCEERQANNLEVISASWTDDTSAVNPRGSRPGKIKHFLNHTIEIKKDQFKHHMFAVVEWFKATPETAGYIPPFSVWHNKCLNNGPSTYLPVQRIIAKCAWAVEWVGNRNYMVISDMPNNFYV